MKERQPTHKLHVIPITISLIGCLSIILIIPAYAQVTNPSTGDTIAQYCSSGICHTPGGPTTIITRNSSSQQVPPQASPIGIVKLSQPCIGNYCSKLNETTQLGKISVKLSQVCETLLKNNMSNSCINYKILRVVDNTNPLYAGQWVEQPWYHRLAPKIKNHEIFNNNPWAVMVDPNSDFAVNSKLITVEDGSFPWINQDDSSIGGLVIKTHVDRRVTSDCNEALVAPNLNLIKDTISYLESGCTTTTYNDTKLTYQKEIPFSYDNQYSTLHLQYYLKLIMNGHSSGITNHTSGGLGPSLCINGKTCNFTDPYKKAGW